MSAPPRGRLAADVAALLPTRILADAAGAPLRTVPDGQGAAEAFGAAQRAAIELRDRPTLVSAGAGAGKTSVLVERCLRLLLEDEELAARDLLAITFTERAAAQMRDRIRTRLDALLAAAGVPREDLPERLRIEDAWIGTYHAVAARLLRRFALDARLDPDVAVLEEGDAARLRREAFDLALPRVLAAEGEDLLELLTRVGPNALRAQTLDLLARRRSQGREPADGAAHGLPVPVEDPAAEAAAADALAAEVLQRAQAAREEIAAAAGARAGEAVLRALAAIDELLAAPPVRTGAPGAPDGRRLQAWRSALPRKAAALKGEAADALRDTLERAVAAADHAVAAPRARRDLALRTALVVETARRYRRRKEDVAALDFDDLLLRLLALLDARPALAELLRERFRHVLVDEHQDGNGLQAQLLRRIARPERTFVVGDRLQAVYGFRFATVEEFDRAAAVAAEHDGRLTLEETFRCPADVLALVNHVGEAAHADYQPLRGGHERPPRGTGPAVELHLVAEDRPTRFGSGPPTSTEPEEEDEDDDLDEPLPQVAPDEARHVAREVARLVADGHAPSEIALLVRATTRTGGLELALLAAGVDVVPAAGRALLETLEARELEAWLRACASVHDDVALLGALRLPTAGVDADALVPLVAVHRAARAAAPEGEEPSLWETLEALEVERLDAPEAARDDLELQRDLLRRHRLALVTDGPAAILERVLADEAYRAGLLARPGGPRRWAAATATVEWVLARELGGEGASEILGRIAEQREDGPPVPVLADAEAVRITTVHRAKGLEWPVVLAVDLGSRRRPHRAAVSLGRTPEDDRIGMKVPVDGREVELWDRPALELERKEAEAAEERRLVHVAMTRAKERLVLCGTWRRDKDDAGRLDPKQAKAVAEHDRIPTSATLQWLAPLLGAPEGWPGTGETTDVAVRDPAAPDRPAATVRLRLVEPRDEDRPDGAEVDAAVASERPAGAAAAAPTPVDDPQPTEASRRGQEPPATPRPAAPAGPEAPQGAEAWDDPAHAPYPLASPTSFSSITRRLAAADPHVVAWEPEPVAGGEIGPALRGSLVHALLEDRLGAEVVEERPTTEREVLAHLRAAEPRLEPLPGRAAEVAAAVDALLATEAARRAAATPRSRRHVERPVILDVDPDRPLVHGVLDLWLEDDDGAVTIVDWKTHRLAPDEDPAALVDGAYRLQRSLYALAALQAGHPRVEVWFALSAAPDRPVVARYAAADVPALRAEVVAAVDRAQRIPPGGPPGTLRP